MSKCKNRVDGTEEMCGLEIKWKYAYQQVPAGEKNVPLNPDGSLHWPTCRGNPNVPSVIQRAPDVQKGTKLLKEELTKESQEFETADARMDFDRTHKLVELSISKTRKVNEQTIPQIHQFENLDYFINAKVECEINADFQRIVREKFAEITLAIDKEIELDRLRLSGLKEE